MGFISEFKEFAIKGNLIDIAIGFVMGAAFGKVTSAFIDGMIMPIVGMVQGKDLSDWQFVLKEEVKDATGKVIEPVVAIKYGAFITVTIEFLIIALVMFLVIKAINRLKRKNADLPPPPAPPTKEEVLLTEIRDAIKSGRSVV